MKFSFFLSVFFALVFFTSKASDLRELNGYRVAFFPNNYGSVVNKVATKLRKAGMSVYDKKSSLERDADYINDKYLMLNCTVYHDYNYPHTTIGVKFQNLKGEIVFSAMESTRGKAFTSFSVDNDENWVIDKIFRGFQSSPYQFDKRRSLTYQEILKMPKLEILNENEETLKLYYQTSSIDAIEGIYKSHQSQNLGYYKIGIKRVDNIYKAIVIETDQKHWKVGEVKAEFQKTSAPGLFSVKWFMANKETVETFAKIDQNIILKIEFYDRSRQLNVQSAFIKLYPELNSNGSDNSSGRPIATGSGVLISKNGYIATNAHVVAGGKSFDISMNGPNSTKVSYKASIVLVDKVNDIAVLKIDDDFTPRDLIPFELNTQPTVGEDIFTIGFPLSSLMGNNYKVSKGIIGANTGVKDDVRFLQISAPLQPGNSGGPLFNTKGELLGLTTAVLNEDAAGTKVENVNYAIKVIYLKSICEMIPDFESEFTNDVSELSFEKQVEYLKDYVCLITVSE